MSRLGPYSAPDAYKKMDGRTWEAKLLAATRRDLIEHVGGKPSAPQKALIDRCAWLTLHLAQIDRRTAEGTCMSAHDSATYLAWSNTLTRTLGRLGLKSAAERPRSLQEHMAERQAAA